tara:strand:- start:184 stop:384 length:201 start_codon:yes stop_codon:yes gene_type:complete
MKNTIYRVFNNKGKYQQSYSGLLPDSHKWAVQCADLVNGEVYKVIVDKKGQAESSSKVFPKKRNGD